MKIVFYQKDKKVYVVGYNQEENLQERSKLIWLFGNANPINENEMKGVFVGPRKEMITPWSTNAVEITQHMGVSGIFRIEEFTQSDDESPVYDPMLQSVYKNLDQKVFDVPAKVEPIVYIEDISVYNDKEGLALNADEINYLKSLSEKLGRALTDSEVFGFSQVNSEHCRHKIFNGEFIINGEVQPNTLFGMIKSTSKANHNRIVSAYKDNCAFIQGPKISQFAPERQDVPAFFKTKEINSVISLKAETHNFPTTVEPFNGAATGTGGEIRDRMAGGRAAIPIAGTAVYMTSYPRLEENRLWEEKIAPRKWLYRSPENILIRASNGASDFGNKFGQPLICGSLFTFEHEENDKVMGFDKVIMLAGGIGYANLEHSEKNKPEVGDKVILMGGDNYRIGMGGGAVSSVDTGVYDNSIELNAVQRSNPEMQKRVCNVIRAMSEADNNPIISIHDHGAGGHLNCLSELVEETGGVIKLDKLPVGDPTLSAKEIVGNESQERMGLVVSDDNVELIKKIADRERAPMYNIGDVTGDMRFVFEDGRTGEKPIDLELNDMFGNPPKTIMEDERVEANYSNPEYSNEQINAYIKEVLKIEAVASKDWLTNKVDRSVTGRVARQQCQGQLQLPLSDLGAVALDFQNNKGIATSIGHSPVSALVDSEKGSRLSIAEAITNISFAPIEGGIKGLSLSANWMWPCRNKGEDARLYEAVQAASKFAIGIGVNIPTGKDSLSMTQSYGDKKVNSPGTVIISTVGEVKDITKIVSPVLKCDKDAEIIHIDFSKDSFKLGGSALYQSMGYVGNDIPDVKDTAYFVNAFESLQNIIENGFVLAGHDISSGGILTTLLEMCFADNRNGLSLNLSFMPESDIIKILFSENPGVIIQVKKSDAKTVASTLDNNGVIYNFMGSMGDSGLLNIKHNNANTSINIAEMRDIWMRTSYLLDDKQTSNGLAKERYDNYKKHELSYKFPENFDKQITEALKFDGEKPRAAIIREKGVNGDREMAWSLYLAGFDVKDVHMTDLMSGREDLKDVNMIVFVGGFSNSDVLGSAKGWAGAFKYNEKAEKALNDFYDREDTLSLGVCNGCQLMAELDLVYPEQKNHPKLLHNSSHKFESGFVNVDITPNNSVMLGSLSGLRLGVWIAHGEGRFGFEQSEDKYNIPMKYSYDTYPANPNGSPYSTAAICSENGRHLAMMPHIERSIYAWNWGWYNEERGINEVTPWIQAFVNAREWIIKTKNICH